MRQLLVLSILATLVCPARAQDQAVPDYAQLIPAGAVGLVHVPSIKRLEQVVGQVMVHFGQPAEAGAAIIGEMRREMPMGLGEMAATDKSIFIAVAMPDGGMQPEVTIILPMTDPDAAKENGMTVAGSYAAIMPMGGSPSTNGKGHPLLANLPMDSAVLRVNLAPLLENYGGMMIAGIEMASSQIPMDQMPEGLDMDTVIDSVIEFVEMFVESGDRMELVLGFDGNVASFSTRFDWKADSPFGKAASGRTGVPAAVRMAQALPKDFAMSMASGYDMTEFMKFMANMGPAIMDGGGAMFPKPIQELMLKAYGTYEGQTGRQAMGLDILPGAIKMASLAEVADGKAHLTKLSGLMNSVAEMAGEMGVSLKTTLKLPEEGPAKLSSVVEISESFDEMVDQPGATAMIHKVLGETIGVQMVGSGSMFGMGFGLSEAEVMKLIGGGQGGKVPAELGRALRLGGTHPMMGMTLDFGSLANGVTSIMKQLELPMPTPDFSKAGSARIWLGLGDSKNAFVMGFKADLANIGKLAQAAMKAK